jgi:hypothetical protein
MDFFGAQFLCSRTFHQQLLEKECCLQQQVLLAQQVFHQPLQLQLEGEQKQVVAQLVMAWVVQKVVQKEVQKEVAQVVVMAQVWVGNLLR